MLLVLHLLVRGQRQNKRAETATLCQQVAATGLKRLCDVKHNSREGNTNDYSTRNSLQEDIHVNVILAHYDQASERESLLRLSTNHCNERAVFVYVPYVQLQPVQESFSMIQHLLLSPATRFSAFG